MCSIVVAVFLSPTYPTQAKKCSHRMGSLLKFSLNNITLVASAWYFIWYMFVSGSAFGMHCFWTSTRAPNWVLIVCLSLKLCHVIFLALRLWFCRRYTPLCSGSQNDLFSQREARSAICLVGYLALCLHTIALNLESFASSQIQVSIPHRPPPVGFRMFHTNNNPDRGPNL